MGYIERQEMKEITEKEAMLRLAALCSQAEHCTHEMVEKMRKWQLPDDAQQRIVEYLAANKFIDDARYAEMFVKDKLRYNKWGRKKIEQALWAKHIDDDTRAGALALITDDDYAAVLRPLIAGKRKTLKGAYGYELNARLTRFALGRGFDYHIIRRCIDGPAPCYDDDDTIMD